jgi:hypothetical protein
VATGPYVKVGGALTLFVLVVYWFNPAKLVISAPAGSKLHLSIPSLGKPGIEASMPDKLALLVILRPGRG